MAIAPIAAMETACGGVVVPNLRGKTVPDARTLLASHGRRPDGHPDPGAGDLDAATGLRKQGLTEYEACSGTDYGFCTVR